MRYARGIEALPSGSAENASRTRMRACEGACVGRASALTELRFGFFSSLARGRFERAMSELSPDRGEGSPKAYGRALDPLVRAMRLLSRGTRRRGSFGRWRVGGLVCLTAALAQIGAIA